MHFNADHLSFSPFVPKVFQGKRTLTNFKYRNAILDIEMDGYGNAIESFSIDGKALPENIIPDTLEGNHKVKIVLADAEIPAQKINSVENRFSPQMPVVRYHEGTLLWKDISTHLSTFRVLKNGKLWKETSDTSINIDPNIYGNYQIIAVGESGKISFASEPLQIYPKTDKEIIQLENFAPRSEKSYQGFTGSGFVEISTTVNKKLDFPITVPEDGKYLMDIRYANGNGPINTENKCAFRTIYIDGQNPGTLVFPQRGKDEWSNWGWSNQIAVSLTKGVHQVSINYESWNENMNGAVNEAMLDCVRMVRKD